MLKQHEHERAYALWNGLADFPAADVDGALRFLMENLAACIRADNVIWVGAARVQSGREAKRDQLRGWRGRCVKQLDTTPAQLRKSANAARAQDTDPGMTTIALAAGAGQFRAHRLRDGFIDFARFRDTAHYRDFYQGVDLVDRIWVAMPVNEDAESYFLFDLHRTRRRFAAADAAFVAHVLRGLKWFHRLLLLSHGLLLAEAPFTASQRALLVQLLTDAKEADIARSLQLSQGTVHQYAVALYRKLGVKGRAGLMALWLSA